MPKSFSKLLLFLFLCLSMAGCSVVDSVLLPDPEESAQDLFEAGNDAMLEKDYLASIKHFTKLKENYPFSPYTVEAELSLADAYFLDGEWLMASEFYKEFESLHPRHTAIPYVLYQIGMSNMNSYRSVDRPPTFVREAYAYFTRVQDSYPDDEYAEKSAEQIKKCRRLLAEYEIYTGDFYFRTENYGAAWLRYKVVVDSYKDIEDLHRYASEKIHAAYLLRSQKEAEEERRAREGSWKDWFNWL